MTDNVIIITGPTASGKSDIAIKVAQAFNGEIISADSQQVYKEMNIGTNKLINDLGICHHLIDEVYPDDNYTVEDFSKKARKLIKEINNKGKVPIIAGGTGFYIDSILFNMNYGQSPRNEEIRQRLNQVKDDKGNEFLYNELYKIDPITAKKYHPNEVNRIIRALEIYESTGVIPSKARRGEKVLNKEINPILFFLNYESRKELYEKINNRVIFMINDGLIDEFVSIKSKYNLSKQSQSMAAIGYKEIFEYLDGNIDIDQLIDLIQKNTRHYAKRQVTWMKRYLEYGFSHQIMMDNLNKNDAADIIISIIKDVYEF